MSDILQRIVAVKHQEVAQARAERDLASLRRDAEHTAADHGAIRPRGFERALRAAVMREPVCSMQKRSSALRASLARLRAASSGSS